MAARPSTRTYRLLDRDPTGLGLGGRRLSPFVGREPELTILLDRLGQVRATSRGHVVALMGEPGAGKSRLLLEFRQALAGGDTLLEGRCASYAATSPYSALADMLRRAWALDPEQSPAGWLQRLQTLLPGLGLDPEALTPYVLTLLGIEKASPALISLSPEAIRTRVFAALQQILHAHACSGSLVLLIEDRHWMDLTSEAFVASFVDSLPGLPCLLVLTTRPGPQSSWLGRSWASQLALPPLSVSDSRRIVQAIVPGLSAPALDQVARRGDGNPFLLEELACTVAEHGTTDEPTSVPVTVAAALAVRMDRLPPVARRTLETAAVIGREVSLTLLQNIADAPEGVVVQLTELVRQELMYQRGNALYVFKHALTQDVAYARLPVPERERLHTAVATALEQFRGGQPDHALDQLAHHWARTGNHAKAIHYLTRLAERATAAYAIDEALAALDAADTHARRLPAGRERDLAVLDLLVRRGLPLIQLGRFAEARDCFDSERPVAERLPGHPIVGPYYALLGLALDHLGERVDASATAHRAIEEADRCGDSVTVGKACFVLALEAFWSGQFEDGLRHAQRGSVCLGDSTESWWVGHLHWIAGVNAATLGALDTARAAGDETYRVGERSADPRLRSYGRWLAGWASIIAGRPDVGLAACKESYDLAPDPLCKAVAAQWLGFACLESGLTDAAVSHLGDAVEQYVAFRFRTLEGWASAWLGGALVAQGSLEKAMAVAARALEVSETSGFAYASGLARRALGQAAHAAGDLPTASHELATAADVLTRIGAAPDAALARIHLAAVCHALGARASAIEHLNAATRTLADLGAGMARVAIHELAIALGVSPDDAACGGVATSTGLDD
jgi:tetratricopeptide (TPR) repeat protein